MTYTIDNQAALFKELISIALLGSKAVGYGLVAERNQETARAQLVEFAGKINPQDGIELLKDIAQQEVRSLDPSKTKFDALLKLLDIATEQSPDKLADAIQFTKDHSVQGPFWALQNEGRPIKWGVEERRSKIIPAIAAAEARLAEAPVPIAGSRITIQQPVIGG